MLIIHPNNQNIELDISKDSSIYELKKAISTRKKIGIDQIHILSKEASSNGDNIPETSSTGLKNTDTIQGLDQVILKIVKNRCSVCLRKSAPIVGDCAYCKCAYCAHHRLPEVHLCPCLSDCKKEHFDKNFKTVMEQKCVASQL
jgi:hypothetical protein